jgi:hypothetical protein
MNSNKKEKKAKNKLKNTPRIAVWLTALILTMVEMEQVARLLLFTLKNIPIGLWLMGSTK